MKKKYWWALKQQTYVSLEKELVYLIEHNFIFKLKMTWKQTHVFLFKNSSYEYDGTEMFRVNNLYKESSTGLNYFYLQSFNFPRNVLKEAQFEITILTDRQFNNLIR